ncbi:MAG: aspartate 1-decarboxylase [Gammaproteobacteria bacterium]|nr:aspartate 1-decarboxylase [Gammaproteobacteria bacterium]
MITTMLKAKLHRVRVTHAELDYEGSCAIDSAWLELSGIREYEQIEIYNVTNGERFSTYAIRAERHSGVISINGAAAHKADPHDIIIICAYIGLSQQELANYAPTLLYFDEKNQLTRTAQQIPIQPKIRS